MRLVRPIAALSAILLLAPHALAKGAAKAPAKAAAKADGAPRSFLWRVEGPGGTGWLAGSIHMADASVYPLPKAMTDAFAQSPLLVVEADIAGPGTADQQAMLRLAMLPPGEKLSQRISPEAWAAFEKAATDMGLKPDGFQPFKPWFAAVSLGAIAVQRAGLDPEQGIDRHFLNLARGEKAVLELEGVEGQLRIFDALPAEQQELLLRYTLVEPTFIGRDLAKLVAAWKSGDAAAVEKILTESVREYPDAKPVYDVLFSKRNAAMAARVEELVKAGRRPFVLVGAGHLVGEDGIVALLRKKGFKVEQR